MTPTPDIVALQAIFDQIDVGELRAALLREECKHSLKFFVETFWHTVEPGRELVDGWWLDCWCAHLEAVANGEVTRLLGNCPPGFSKSLITNVFFPTWEWGPRGRPDLRYLSISYSSALTERDNMRCIQVIRSELYQELWGDRFSASDSRVKIMNDKTGWKLATSVGGIGTGERADRLLLDDLNNVRDVESQTVRESTIHWIREVMPSRVNDMQRSAIICLQQRTHEDDATGTLLSLQSTDWTHVLVPMRFDPGARCETPFFEDPRTETGELAWPERFPEAELAALEESLGPFGTAAQMQQQPQPRGGGIVMDTWWQVWPPANEEHLWLQMHEVGGKRKALLQYPDCSYIVVSVDTAYTEKEANDWSACTVWGVFQDKARNPKVILKNAWRERLEISALVHKLMSTCEDYRADTLLIEAKASGLSVAQEMRRLMRAGDYLVQTIVPKGDKTARLHAVVPMFAGGLVYAPQRPWADAVVAEVAAFPKARHDDFVDSCSMALNYLRRNNLAKLSSEVEAEYADDVTWRGRKERVYDV